MRCSYFFTHTSHIFCVVLYELFRWAKKITAEDTEYLPQTKDWKLFMILTYFLWSCILTLIVWVIDKCHTYLGVKDQWQVSYYIKTANSLKDTKITYLPKVGSIKQKSSASIAVKGGSWKDSRWLSDNGSANKTRMPFPKTLSEILQLL